MATANSGLNQKAADLGDTRSDQESAASNSSFVMGYGLVLVMIAVATLVAFGLDSGMSIPNLSLVYVIPVIAAGAMHGIGPSLFAAVFGALAYNFFFTEPRFTLMVDDPANIWAIALLLIVGVTVSTIAFGARRRAADIALLTREVGVLQRFGRDIGTAADRDAILAITSQTLASVFQAPAVVIATVDGEVAAFKATGGLQPTAADFAAAKTAIDLGAVSRAGMYPAQDSRFDFWPVGNAGAPAVIGLAFGSANRPSTQDELVDIVRHTLALGLDRADLRASTAPNAALARN